MTPLSSQSKHVLVVDIVVWWNRRLLAGPDGWWRGDLRRAVARVRPGSGSARVHRDFAGSGGSDILRWFSGTLAGKKG
jgi:hypothetical protein